MIELIVNPVAGNGLAREIAMKAVQRLKERSIAFELHMTEHPGQATALAKEAAGRGAETVIAFGGDGTITETAAGLRGTKTALGIIPSGTGNDFIKSAGIPRRWEEALDFILTHPARPVNSGMANERLFLNECGTGFDVMVLDFAEHVKTRLRGMLPYLYGVLRAVAAFRPIPMHIEIGDDTVLDGSYMVCAIGNGSYIGGGIPITPGADLTDGLLDVLVVDAVPRWRIPFYLPALLKGTLHTKKNVAHRYLVPYCHLKCEHMRLNLDGEILPMDEARFTCESDALLLHW